MALDSNCRVALGCFAEGQNRLQLHLLGATVALAPLTEAAAESPLAQWVLDCLGASRAAAAELLTWALRHPAVEPMARPSLPWRPAV